MTDNRTPPFVRWADDQVVAGKTVTLTGMTDKQLADHWRNVPVMKPGDKYPWETFQDDPRTDDFDHDLPNTPSA